MLELIPKETHVHLDHSHFQHYENGREAAKTLLEPAISNLIQHGTRIVIAVPDDINFLKGGFNAPDFMLGLYEAPMTALKQELFPDLHIPKKANLSLVREDQAIVPIEEALSKLGEFFNNAASTYLEFRRLFNDSFALGIEHDDRPMDYIRYDNNYGLLINERPVTDMDRNTSYIVEKFFEAFDTLCLADFDLSDHHGHLIADSQQNNITEINRRLQELRRS